jgi:alpha-galactosidase
MVFGAHLAWSGNHQQTIEWLHDGQYQWQLGEWLAPGEGLLAPGASLATPEVVASCSLSGFDGLAANFHAELRARLAWPSGRMRPRPVHLNPWEGFYFDVHPGPARAVRSGGTALWRCCAARPRRGDIGSRCRRTRPGGTASRASRCQRKPAAASWH